MMMGLTAELLAKRHNISRTEQETFAVRSHRRVHVATMGGAFKGEIIAIEGHDAEGHLRLVTADEVM
jgi:acetyl-CoA acyltransferase